MIQSIERCMSLLELLSSAGSEGLGLGELAERAELKVPTAHNILATLLKLGYAAQTDRRRYVLGAKARQLALSGGTLQKLAQHAHALMSELVRRVQETAVFCIYDGGKRHTLVAVESKQALRVAAQEGKDERLLSTVTGRVLLSLLSEKELENWLGNRVLQEATWPEVRDLASLEAELAHIRARGHCAFSKDALIHALAVPLNLPQCGLRAALGIFYPRGRHPAEGDEWELLLRLQDTAAKIMAFDGG
jgi:IclR family acetate operon transcriptional repressor